MHGVSSAGSFHCPYAQCKVGGLVKSVMNDPSNVKVHVGDVCIWEWDGASVSGNGKIDKK